MKKYTVHLEASGTLDVEVHARNESEAIYKAIKGNKGSFEVLNGTVIHVREKEEQK